jgi:putative tryptophan/tyrosine transport system substrate-binding protein
MRRREFICLAGSALSLRSIAAQAQPSQGIRRIGMILPYVENDEEAQVRVAALRQGLRELGWIEGRNLYIDYHWTGGNADAVRAHVAKVVETKPDLIVAESGMALAAMRQAAGDMPIVFLAVSDPIGNGFVPSLAKPGGRITGFSLFEYEMGGKWLELLKQIAPSIRRVALMQSTRSPNWPGWLRETRARAPLLGLELTQAGVLNTTEIEPTISSFAREPYGALLVLPDPFVTGHRDLIVRLAADYQLPAIYPFNYWAKAGGLVSYGVDRVDLNRRAATYVARILNGEKPGDLPIQAPIKFELVINLKTAKALALDIPPTLLARADKVIE